VRFTENTKLNRYLQRWHDLTFQYETVFQNIDRYHERIRYFEDVLIPKIRSYRNSFKNQMRSDQQMRHDFDRYMADQKDYMVWTNFLMSSPNQKDHRYLKQKTGNKNVPFIAKGYQMLMYEFSKRWSVANLKSRYLGVSYGFYNGFTMDTIYDEDFEFMAMSENENKVDKTGDWSQTHKGRMKSLIRNTGMFDLDKFYNTAFLTLNPYDTGAGFTGSSTTSTATNQKRMHTIWVDEAGLIRVLMDLKDEIEQSDDFTVYTGTLKAGSDTGFRFILKDAIEVNYRAAWKRYKELSRDDLTYREVINKVIDEFTDGIPLGKTIKFKLNWRDDPIKNGKSDYHEIACNECHNDPVAIATQVEADENAPSPDRTLYNATKANIKPAEFFEDLLKNTDGLHWVGGFDPGTLNTTVFVPILRDYQGRLYVMPAVYMTEGDMISFTQKMAMMAPGMTLYPEESVKAYSNIGSGWWTTLNKYSRIMNFKVEISKNRDLEGIALVNNVCLSDNEYNPITGENERRILIHEDNEEWLMNYQQGMKRSGDTDQKKWSHAAEAMMAAIYELHRREDRFRRGGDYGAY